MPITLNCPKCHKPFRVRDESIGGRVRCPSCGTVLQVPAALSPPSHYGADMPRPSIMPGSTERPLADEVPPTRVSAGSDDQVMLGGTGRREDVVDLSGRPPETNLPAPPSIKVKGAGAPPPVPAPPPRQARPAAPTAAMKPQIPSARGRATARLPLGPADDDLAWKKVRGGLGMIRWGLLFIALIILAGFGHAVWAVLDQDRALDPSPGYLKMNEWPRWKEMIVAYSAGLGVPALLLLLAGRIRCGAAPAETRARGLVRWAAFFTVLAILSAAAYVGITYFALWGKTELPADFESKARWSSLFLAIASVLMADVLTILFVGQIGWPLGRPQLQTAVAGFFTYLLLTPAAVLIAHQYYPIPEPIRRGMTLDPEWLHGGIDDATAQQSLIWAVVLLAAVVMLVLRYAGVAGAGRYAIRKHLAGEA